jgi:hypothetical protein
MSPIEQASLEALFKAFAPSQCERWTYLLSRKPKAWQKITPMLAWPVPSQYDSFPNVPLKEMLLSKPLAAHKNTPCVVLSCGHSHLQQVTTLPLSRIFPDGEHNTYEVIFEGFISVVPGRLAIGLNHEGGVCLYET